MFKFGSTLMLFVFLSACSKGTLDTSEVYYLRVSGPEHNAYMKVVVKTNSVGNKVELRQGWYPSEAVDALFGDLSSQNSVKSNESRDKIRAQYSEALASTIEAYLEKAKDPNTTLKDLESYLKAISRVKLMVRNNIENIPGVDSIEYDVSSDVLHRRSGQKLVFVFSADPNDVIAGIESFANHSATKAEISKLVKYVSDREKSDVAIKLELSKIAKNKRDKLIFSQIEIANTSLNARLTKEEALVRVNRLLQLLNALNGGK